MQALSAFWGDWRLSGFVLLVGWILSGALYFWLDRGQERYEIARFDRLVDVLGDRVGDRLNVYTNVLRVAVAFHAASDYVSWQDWGNFVAGLDIPHNYPDASGLVLLQRGPHQ